jgi:uncharacterized protein YqfB (UPF0267 family)
MCNIKIKTAASWEEYINVFGRFETPLNLNVCIKNDNIFPIHLTQICISIKKISHLNTEEEDILGADKNITINANSDFSFEIDVAHILNDYSETQNFTVKININDNHPHESKILNVRMLNDAKRHTNQ